MRMLTIRWLIVSLAAAGVVAAYFFSSFAREEPAVAVLVPQVSKPSPASAAVRDAETKAILVVAPAIAAMRARFESATNYAAFIQDALQRPREGGRFYGLLAYYRCQTVQHLELEQAKKKGSQSSARDRAIKVVTDLKERCSGVASQFQDDAAFMRAILRENARGEPDALLIVRGALKPPEAAFSAEDMARAKRSGDSYLLAATMEVNADFFAERIDPAYAEGEKRNVLYQAAAAAACEIAGNCRDNMHVSIACVVEDICGHGDFRDALRISVAPESRPLFDKTRLALLRLARD